MTGRSGRRRREPDRARHAPAVTQEMAKGFTLYMMKAVMSGRGDELIDLARTNL